MYSKEYKEQLCINMDIDEWLWRNKKTKKQVARDLKINYLTFQKIVSRKHPPSLFNALAIFTYTQGKVDLTSFLTEEERQKLKDFEEAIPS